VRQLRNSFLATWAALAVALLTVDLSRCAKEEAAQLDDKLAEAGFVAVRTPEVTAVARGKPATNPFGAWSEAPKLILVRSRPLVAASIKATRRLTTNFDRRCGPNVRWRRSLVSPRATYDGSLSERQLSIRGFETEPALCFTAILREPPPDQPSSSFNSGTVNQTHARLAASSIAVTTNTQRMPKPAAIPPPSNGPSELPRNVAEDVIP
jgi:hypothetical protein